MLLLRRVILFFVLDALLIGCQSLLPEQTEAAIDPFDYNYCGGVPVYPVIGVTFATKCGPRNQIVLGRYGTLMWIYPSTDGKSAKLQGSRKLDQSDVKMLTLLAEVTQLADPLTPEPGLINFQVGINFSGRENKRVRGVFDTHHTPARELLDAMRELVSGEPELPDCHVQPMFFDPTVLPDKRRAMTLGEMLSNQGMSYAKE